jgi:hypothetical protein
MREKRLSDKDRRFTNMKLGYRTSRLHIFSQEIGKEILITTAIQQFAGGLHAAAKDARVAVGRITHEREQFRDERRIDAEFFAVPIPPNSQPFLDDELAFVIQMLQKINV